MAVRERVTPESGKVVDMSWDPITRIVGNLGIYTKIDFNQKEVVSCKSTSSLFRGYSVFMKGKDPRDAHFITSRICGICGDNHATCSCYAQNMAYGVAPPHAAITAAIAVLTPEARIVSGVSAGRFGSAGPSISTTAWKTTI